MSPFLPPASDLVLQVYGASSEKKIEHKSKQTTFVLATIRCPQSQCILLIIYLFLCFLASRLSHQTGQMAEILAPVMTKEINIEEMQFFFALFSHYPYLTLVL